VKSEFLAVARLLFGGGFGGFDFGSGVGVFLGEAFDAAGGVHEFLLAGEEGVAVGADFDVEPVAFDGRARLKIVAAGAVHHDGVIVGMNTGFHEAPSVASGLHGLPAKPGEYSRVARSRGNHYYRGIREHLQIV